MSRQGAAKADVEPVIETNRGQTRMNLRIVMAPSLDGPIGHAAAMSASAQNGNVSFGWKAAVRVASRGKHFARTARQVRIALQPFS